MTRRGQHAHGGSGRTMSGREVALWVIGIIVLFAVLMAGVQGALQ